MEHWQGSGHLTIALERQRVVLEPVAAATASFCLVVGMPLANAAVLPANRCQAARFAMLVHCLGYPVDARVAADDLVVRIDENHLVVFVRGILVDPVRVEDAEVSTAAAHALLSGGADGALV